MPVGDETLGRIMNVIGEPVDEAGPVKTKTRQRAIHQDAQGFVEQASRGARIFVTGIKVVDLIRSLCDAAARSACSVVPAWARPC